MAEQVWPLPPIVKIYEALGAIADGRVKINGDTAQVTSSSGGKVYDVLYEPDDHQITANDNASYWAGYLGYPAIAYLMAADIVSCDPKITSGLRGIPWKDINTQYKNDYDRVEQHISSLVSERGDDFASIKKYSHTILDELGRLNLIKGKRKRPPVGY